MVDRKSDAGDENHSIFGYHKGGLLACKFAIESATEFGDTEYTPIYDARGRDRESYRNASQALWTRNECSYR